MVSCEDFAFLHPFFYRTVPLKCKLPPLVSFLARRVSFLARRVSFLSRRVSFLSRRDSFLARVTEPNILEYITREKPLSSLSRSTCIDHKRANANADCSLTTGVHVVVASTSTCRFVCLPETLSSRRCNFVTSRHI